MLVVQTANLRHACTVKEHYDTYPEVISGKKVRVLRRYSSEVEIHIIYYDLYIFDTFEVLSKYFRRTSMLCVRHFVPSSYVLFCKQ